MSQPSAASRPTVEKTKQATVLSRGLFRETARMKHGAKQSERHEMSAESITRTGCPESTPIAECCFDATTTNDMTANGGARRCIARPWRQRMWRPKAGRSETRQTQLRLDTPTMRRRTAAQTMPTCHARRIRPFAGCVLTHQRTVDRRQIRMYKLRRYIHKQTHHIANRRSE